MLFSLLLIVLHGIVRADISPAKLASAEAFGGSRCVQVTLKFPLCILFAGHFFCTFFFLTSSLSFFCTKKKMGDGDAITLLCLLVCCLLGSCSIVIAILSLMQPLRLPHNCTVLSSWQTSFDCVANPQTKDGVPCKNAVPVYHYLVQMQLADADAGPLQKICGENHETCTCCDATGCINQVTNGLASFDCAPVFHNFTSDLCWQDPENGRVYSHELKPEPTSAALLLILGVFMIAPNVLLLLVSVLFPFLRMCCSWCSSCSSYLSRWRSSSSRGSMRRNHHHLQEEFEL